MKILESQNFKSVALLTIYHCYTTFFQIKGLCIVVRLVIGKCHQGDCRNLDVSSTEASLKPGFHMFAKIVR